MKTALTPERKVEKLIPRWEINRHAEGYKWGIDQNWGRMAKMGFWAQKKDSLLRIHHVLAKTEKSCSKKKVAFAQIIITQNIRPRNTFRPNVKTPLARKQIFLGGWSQWESCSPGYSVYMPH